MIPLNESHDFQFFSYLETWKWTEWGAWHQAVDARRQIARRKFERRAWQIQNFATNSPRKHKTTYWWIWSNVKHSNNISDEYGISKNFIWRLSKFVRNLNLKLYSSQNEVWHEPLMPLPLSIFSGPGNLEASWFLFFSVSFFFFVVFFVFVFVFFYNTKSIFIVNLYKIYRYIYTR